MKQVDVRIPSYAYSAVVTQFWIHQDFLECYFISIIIIHKNPKKLRKSLKFKNIFFSVNGIFP